MHFLIPAFVLSSRLPWCGITAAAAKPADASQDLHETDGVYVASVTDASISDPPKTTLPRNPMVTASDTMSGDGTGSTKSLGIRFAMGVCADTRAEPAGIL